MEGGGTAGAAPPPARPFPGRRRPFGGPLRLLCKSSTVDALTSRLPDPLDLIARDTGSSIAVVEPHPRCAVRFVVVDRGRAAEALARVFESAAEAEGAGGAGREDAVCRVLMAKIVVGLFMGKKGRNVDRIRQESGAKIRVFPLATFVDAAAPTEEVVQIQGDPLSVKKALVAVSAFLQGSLPSEREFSERKFSEMVTQDTSPDACREHKDASTLPVAGNSISHAVSSPKLYNGNHLHETNTMHEISYRLLCANHKVGGVIGHGATIVKALEKETGTYIRCGGIVAQSDERVITITGFESQGTSFSPTQNAVIRVFTRIIEATLEGRAVAEKDGPVVIRLLVPCNQIGCLMVKGGAVMSEIGKITCTDIMIISGGQVPKCASKNDEVIQVSGKFQNVQDCLFRITSKLRDNIFSTKLPVNARPGFRPSDTSDASICKRVEVTCPGVYESSSLSSVAHQQNILPHSLDQLKLHSNDHFSSQQVWGPKIGDAGSLPMSGFDGGQTPFRSGAELRRGGNPVVVTSTTLEIVVPGHSMSLIFGNDGSNFNNIRQISGAKVAVSDILPGASERTIVISGTPDQALAAQSLVQAYLLSGKS